MGELPYRTLTPEQRAACASGENIVHWTRGNVMFMFQGKCANTAIKAAILTAEGGIDESINIHADPRLNYVSREHVIRYRKTVPVLAVVRRPWDRLVSFWRDKIAGRTADNFTATYIPGAYASMPFDEFIGVILRHLDVPGMPTFFTNHVAPAHPYLTAHGQSLPSEIIQFDDLVAGPGYDRLKRWTACAWDLPDTLPVVNKPKQPRPDLSPGLEHRLRIAVYTAYYTDYKLFNWNA